MVPLLLLGDGPFIGGTRATSSWSELMEVTADTERFGPRDIPAILLLPITQDFFSVS